jgi:hypothetical protein
MSLTLTATGRHRAIDRVRELEAENAELRAMAVVSDREITGLTLRGMQAATDLDAALKHKADLQAALDRIDDRHAETVAGMQQQIDDMARRLNTKVLAEHVVTRTQEIDTSTLQFPVITERFEHGDVRRIGVPPLADTQPVPRINQPQEVA